MFACPSLIHAALPLLTLPAKHSQFVVPPAWCVEVQAYQDTMTCWIVAENVK